MKRKYAVLTVILIWVVVGAVIAIGTFQGSVNWNVVQASESFEIYSADPIANPSETPIGSSWSADLGDILSTALPYQASYDFWIKNTGNVNTNYVITDMPVGCTPTWSTKNINLAPGAVQHLTLSLQITAVGSYSFQIVIA